MILLDTNVISEPLKPNPNPRVVAWIDEQAVETLYLSTISVAELRYGIAVLPEGKRKKGLHTCLEERILPIFKGRILTFDLEASAAYARLLAKERADGEGVGLADGYIAAIAATHEFTVATRDTDPFIAVGIPVINPWESAEDDPC